MKLNSLAALYERTGTEKYRLEYDGKRVKIVA